MFGTSSQAPSVAPQHGSTAVTDSATIIINFGPYKFRTNTPYIGPLRHSVDTQASVFNALQLKYWKSALKTHEYYGCLTDPNVEAKYKQHNANRTGSLEKIENLKRAATAAQESHDDRDSQLEASFALMGRDTEVQNPARLTSTQTAVVERQRDHYAHLLEQSRSRIKNIQEQIKFDDHEHIETSKLVKQALTVLRTMFNTSASGANCFRRPSTVLSLRWEIA